MSKTETLIAAWENLGRPTILYERTYFSRLTRREFDASHPDIANKAQGRHGLFRDQYPKLYRAAVLNERAALQSASYGMFQIMGANYSMCGYSDVGSFVDAMMASEVNQLNAFVNYIRANKPAHEAIQAHDWATFALHYNGPDYRANDYDDKLSAAFQALAPPPQKPATSGPKTK